MNTQRHDSPVVLSIGIMARNEEASITAMLDSLARQTVFTAIAARHGRCEVICLANGCTDKTVEIASEVFKAWEANHPARDCLSGRVAALAIPGRNNAWNQFVHELSAPEARYLCVMDADILFDRTDTLRLVLDELERNPRLGAASDLPCKALRRPGHPSLKERISQATSAMTDTIQGRLNGMLYCMRSEIARNLFVPRDLLANDDGFFKAAICTDFFREAPDPSRVALVRGATHLYEPYLSLKDVINNQKRQMIGQTSVYVIVEHLKKLPEAEKARLAETLRRMDKVDPDWLKQLISAHLHRTRRFWRLFPGILTFRWRRLWQMDGPRKLAYFPAASAGFVVTLIACWQASRYLRQGVTIFWPTAARKSIAVAAVATSGS